jgi:hypothetical protein
VTEPSGDAPSSNLSLLLAAGAALVFVAGFSLAGPERSPRAFNVVTNLSALLGALVVLGYGLRQTTAAVLPALSALGGMGLLAVALGIAPELFQLPMAGMGERLWGLPIALAAPLGGAALLTGSERGRVMGGAMALLLIVGLLQLRDILGIVRPALLHNPAPGSLALLALAGFALVGAIHAPLTSLAGKLLVGALPAWSAVQIASASELGLSAAPAAVGFVLATAATVLLVVGLKASQQTAPPARLVRGLTLSSESVVLGIIVVLWLLLKSFTWRWSTTDENIYFYDAVLMAQGQLPYKDFFFAHPPLHAVLPGLLFAIFGFSLSLAKAIPVMATLATAGMIWHVSRTRVGRLAGVFTLGTYLFAFELLQASTNMNGVNLTCMWLVAGYTLLLRDRPATAGAMLGLAITTGFYAIGPALGLVVLAFFRNIPTGIRLAAGFAAVGGGVNFIFFGIGGDEYQQSVYGYHLLKASKDKAPAFIKMLYYHSHLFAGALLAPVVMAWHQLRGVAHPGEPLEAEGKAWFFDPWKLFEERAIGTVKIAWLLLAALLFEFTRFQELYSFYFALLFPFAAICTGYTLSGIAGAAIHELRLLVQGQRGPGILAVVGLCVAFALWVPLANEAQWIFSAKAGKSTNGEYLKQGTVREYRWVEPAVWTSVAGPIVRALFWRDHRERWQMTAGYRHFLWQKSLHLSTAEEISAFVRDNTTEDQTIAGSSLVAPAIALASGRRLAANVVDTNAKRFKTEIYSLPRFFEDVCADNLKYLITSPSGYMNDRMAKRVPAVRKYFRPVKRFEDPWNKFLRPGRRVWAVTLWEVQEGGCRWDTGPQ